MTASSQGQDRQDVWLFDQLTKSEFFHQHLHEYGLLEVAYALEQVEGEHLDWNLADLAITEAAVHLYDGAGNLVGHAVGTFVVLPGVAWE